MLNFWSNRAQSHAKFPSQLNTSVTQWTHRGHIGRSAESFPACATAGRVIARAVAAAAGAQTKALLSLFSNNAYKVLICLHINILHMPLLFFIASDHSRAFIHRIHALKIAIKMTAAADKKI